MLGPQLLSKSGGSMWVTTPLTTRHVDKLWQSYVKICRPSITLVLHYVGEFFFFFDKSLCWGVYKKMCIQMERENFKGMKGNCVCLEVYKGRNLMR